jgi:hypothetical protein
MRGRHNRSQVGVGRLNGLMNIIMTKVCIHIGCLQCKKVLVPSLTDMRVAWHITHTDVCVCVCVCVCVYVCVNITGAYLCAYLCVYPFFQRRESAINPLSACLSIIMHFWCV